MITIDVRWRCDIPFGPKVTETASASLSIPATKPSLHFLSKETRFAPALTTTILFVKTCFLLHNTPQKLCFPDPCFNIYLKK